MNRLTRTLPILLAVALQIMPLLRNFFLNPATGSNIAFILRWGIGTSAALGAYDSISRASAPVIFTTPTNFYGTVGVYFTNNLVLANNGSDGGAYFILNNATVATGQLSDKMSTTNCLPTGLTLTVHDLGAKIYCAVYGTPTRPVTNLWVHVLAGYQNTTPAKTDIFFTIQSNNGPQPPGIGTQPVSTTNVVGGNTGFIVNATGTAPLQFLWFKDGNPLTDGGGIIGSTSNVLTLQNISPNFAGVYFVTVSNALGGVTSSNATLTVVAPPVIVAQPQSLVAATGTVAVLSVQADGANPLAYRWLKNNLTITNGVKFSGVSSSVLTISSLITNDSANFSVIITNSAGTVTSSVATLSVQLPVLFTLQASNRAAKLGTNTVFRAAVKGTTPFFYQWFKDGSPLVDGGNITGSSSNVLTVAVTSTNAGGNYSLFASNAVASVTSSNALLAVLLPPVITVAPTNQSVVVSNGVSFSVAVEGTSPFKYQWKKAVTAKGKTTMAVIKGATNAVFTLASAKTTDAAGYFVIVNNRAGAVTSSVANLAVLVPAAFTLQASNRAVKLGTNTFFRAAAKGSAPFTFQWFKDGNPLADGGNISGATSNVLAVTALTTNDNGNYWLVASNAVNAIISSNALLTVILPPVVMVTPTSQSVVVSNAATFTVLVEGTAPFKYQWRKGATLLKGATNATFTLPMAKFTDAATNYSVTITNRAGSAVCSNIALAVLATTGLVAPAAVASATTTPPGEIKIIAQADGSITVSLTGSPNISYTLEAAEDLTAPAWHLIGSTTAAADGAWQMTDTNAVSQPLRFYRVRSP